MPGRPSEGGSSGTDIDCFVEVNVKVKRIHGVDLTCSLVENVSGIGSMRQLVKRVVVPRTEAMLNLQNLSASLICGIHDGRKVYSGEGCWDMAIGEFFDRGPPLSVVLRDEDARQSIATALHRLQQT